MRTQESCLLPFFFLILNSFIVVYFRVVLWIFCNGIFIVTMLYNFGLQIFFVLNSIEFEWEVLGALGSQRSVLPTIINKTGPDE